MYVHTIPEQQKNLEEPMERFFLLPIMVCNIILPVLLHQMLSVQSRIAELRSMFHLRCIHFLVCFAFTASNGPETKTVVDTQVHGSHCFVGLFHPLWVR